MPRMSKKPILHETYRGYKIWHRPWLKRRPYQCEVPHFPGQSRKSDRGNVAGCRNMIDRGINYLQQTLFNPEHTADDD